MFFFFFHFLVFLLSGMPGLTQKSITGIPGKEIRRKECSRSEMIVYGYYPMMISAQCVKKTCGTCDHQSGTVQLKDRYGNYFMTKSFCDFCYTVIYNSVPTSLWEETEQIKSAGVQALRMNFTWENRKECKRLLEFFVQKKKNAYLHPFSRSVYIIANLTRQLYVMFIIPLFLFLK